MIDPAIASIASLMRGELPAGPVDDDFADAIIDAARYHGVAPLLDARLRRGPLAGWSESIRHACRKDALVQAMSEHMNQPELRRVLDALAAEDIAPLILKGTALAYSHYASPALRPRVDCDLLVAPADREAAKRVLDAAGYVRVSGPAGTYVGYQLALMHTNVHGASHVIDLHWRMSDLQSFAWLFSFDELLAESLPVEALHPAARRLGDAHALIHALLHRVDNNLYFEAGFGDRLIWLYDLRLLADAMSDDELARFVRRACDKRIVAFAIDGLRRCAERFPSPRIFETIAALEASPAAASGAPFLRAGKLGREWREIKAIPTAGARLAYLAGRLWPDAEYMRERFADAQSRALPLLHARRWLAGLDPRRSGGGR